ncbi:MAG: hypothetical protein JNM04_01400 [Chthonomonas sp.]|nr:hypothetical protein [Chthonomonas sp.]
MKKVFLAIALFSCVLGSMANAQTTKADAGKRADEILAKVHELDLLNQLLPVLMTKEQMRKILPSVEKAREMVKATEKGEAEQLEKLAAKIDPVLKEAYEKNKVPSQDVLLEYAKTFVKLRVVRRSVIESNTTAVLEVVQKTLDKGQLAAARNALDPKLIDPSLDKEKMSDDDKMRFWVKVILLDPQTYTILLKLSK